MRTFTSVFWLSDSPNILEVQKPNEFFNCFMLKKCKFKLHFKCSRVMSRYVSNWSTFNLTKNTFMLSPQTILKR